MTARVWRRLSKAGFLTLCVSVVLKATAPVDAAEPSGTGITTEPDELQSVESKPVGSHSVEHQSHSGRQSVDFHSVKLQSVEPLTELTDAFKREKTGWIGADGAYSIKLNDTTSLWTFGDTWIGKLDGKGRSKDTKMINNSAALQNIAEHGGDLKFIWNGDSRKPSSLWVSKEDGTYYWPGDGIAIDGKFYTFLHKIKADKSRPEPFQFRTVTDDLVCVENPLDSPNDWKMTYTSFNNDAEKVQHATATIRDGEFLYIFCSYPEAKNGLNAHPAILARLQIASLKSLSLNDIEYFCSSDSSSSNETIWSKTTNSPVVLFPDGAPEMSVSKVDGIPGYVAVYMPPLSKKIVMRHATSLSSSWSEPITLYECPESDDNIILYSAKAHPELARKPLELVVTYCRNSKDWKTHFENADIYYPRAIRVLLSAGKL